jgi:hypothetical protein
MRGEDLVQRARFIKAGLAAAAALSIAPAAAGAATLRDAASADFGAGTPGTSTWVVEPGEVRLKSDVAANFDGVALAPGFTATPWGAGGGSLVADGTATVNGARVNTDAMFAGPRVLEFRATFGPAAFQHIGLGNTFNEPLWAQFSTGTGDGTLPVGLYARTAPGQDVAITTVDPQQPHTYRIERSASAVTFFIDGIQMGSPHPFVATDEMRPVASDFNADTTNIKVDWLALGPYPSSGAFVSRVHEASDPRAVWGALTAVSAGGGVTFETRSGRTATPGADWSDWQATGAGGAIQSPPGRYIQYRATLAPAATGASPSLTSVELTYEVDTAPDASIGGVQVTGRTATVTFSSTAADVQRFECSLDGGAFAACASPQTFSGLAPGAHVVTVRAVDRAGNTGPEVASTFTVSEPAGSGDATLPAVTVTPKSLRASKSGKVKVRVRCPDAEIRCSVKLTLKRGNAAAARKTLTVAGGLSRWVTLRLDRATRSRLAARGRLKARMVVAAVDAAGNKQTTTHALKLRAA